MHSLCGDDVEYDFDQSVNHNPSHPKHPKTQIYDAVSYPKPPFRSAQHKIGWVNTHHMASAIIQLVSRQNKPPLPPIPPLRSTFHQITR